LAATVGVMRTISSLARDKSNTKDKNFGWHSDIEGALAECALAKWQGVFWDGGINTFKAPDVGLMQVRHTPYTDGHLIVRTADKDDERYALVTGQFGTYHIHGWCYGSFAKQDKYIKDDDSWFVPQQDLTDFSIPA
jgi:hypothetical protein